MAPGAQHCKCTSACGGEVKVSDLTEGGWEAGHSLDSGSTLFYMW